MGKFNIASCCKYDGFALQMAILLVLLLGGLALAEMRVLSSVEANSYYDAASDRAYQAASTGLMLAEKQLDANMATYAAAVAASVPTANFPTSCADASFTGVLNSAYAVPLNGNNEFSVIVTCDGGSGFARTEGFGTTYVFSLIATACNNVAAGACTRSTNGTPYVERQLKAIYFVTPPNQ